LGSLLTLCIPAAFGGLTSGENGNGSPLPLLHDAPTGLPIYLGVIQQVGEAFAPFIFREKPKRFELRGDGGVGADDDGQPEVAGVAYKIYYVEVFGGWFGKV
jgi:hypothetical protein